MAHLLWEVLSSLEQVLYAVSAPSPLAPSPAAPLGDTDIEEDSPEKQEGHATKVRAILRSRRLDELAPSFGITGEGAGFSP